MAIRLCLAPLAWFCALTPALAQSVADLPPKPSIESSLPNDSDLVRTRSWLKDHGVVFGVILTEDLLANLRGGIKRGAILSGKLETIVGVDLEKLAGMRGLTAYANILQVHGSRGPDRELINNLNTVSNIEAIPTTRLSEVWLEQSFWDGRASLRAGQLVVDTEFLFSQYFSFFNSSDWPTNPSVNIPSGGAAYPLSTPGLRLKVEPKPGLTFLVSLLNGDPAGPGTTDPELRNRYGLNFRVNDPPFLIAETQYAYNQGRADKGLAGGIRLGGWHHFGSFDDQRFDASASRWRAPPA
ncbi:MAG TPA: carbohydrate porin, partial [Aestuariivirgaceae bacterium]|nr:carbohydrate porin [Aestuariivirgaceae bacterium]